MEFQEEKCGFMLGGIANSKCSRENALHSFFHGSPSSFFSHGSPGSWDLWERGASVIYGQLGFLGARERTLGALGIDSCRYLLGKMEKLDLNREELLLPKG